MPSYPSIPDKIEFDLFPLRCRLFSIKVAKSDQVIHGMLEEEQRRREGKGVINEHVSEKNLPELKKQSAEYDKHRKEIQAYKKRMADLERLLGE